MNQQEIDHLFEKYCYYGTDSEGFAAKCVTKDDFTAAIQEADAQARRKALEEANAVWMDAIAYLEANMQLSQIVPKQIPGLFEILKRRVNSKQKASLDAHPPQGIAMNFGMALDSLRAGQKVCRKGWNGKGMWLGYVSGQDWDLDNDLFGEDGDDYEPAPFIFIKTADNKLSPWQPSPADMLATDWMIVDAIRALAAQPQEGK
jgi:hypothetical protein